MFDAVGLETPVNILLALYSNLNIPSNCGYHLGELIKLGLKLTISEVSSITGFSGISSSGSASASAAGFSGNNLNVLCLKVLKQFRLFICKIGMF